MFLAFVHLRNGLHLSNRTSDVAIGIHDLLERVILPAKDVIAVVTESETNGSMLAGPHIIQSSKVILLIAVAPDKRLRAVLRPERLIIELRSIPYRLIHELWHSYWVRGWTWTVRLKGTISRI